jgi:hypothetical protein
MKGDRRLRLFAAASCCLFFASCVYLKNPLSKPDESKADPRLEGKWLVAQDAKQPDDAGNQVQIVRVGGKLPDCVMEYADAENLAAVINGPPQKNDADEKNHTLFFPTQIGNRSFLNVFFVNEKTYQELKEGGWKDDIGSAFMIFRYQADGEKLTVWDVAGDSLRKAIERGQIQGKIEKNKVGSYSLLFFFTFPIYEDDITITDSPETIRKFYGDLDESHFEELFTMTKIK